MPRTRDIAAMGAAIVTLMSMIAVVVATKSAPFSAQTASVVMAPDVGVEAYSAVVPDNFTPDRDGIVARLKSKIAQLAIASPAPEILPDIVSASSTDSKPNTIDPASDQPATIKHCANYSEKQFAWDHRGLKMTEAEGARLVYRNISSVGSSTPPTREVVVELPVRSFASGQNCLSSDTIGIATNGTLITNSTALYNGYSQTDLIGYALDGFPIYGFADIKTDACGGAVVGGQYKYFLDTNREHILGCFAGAAVSI